MTYAVELYLDKESEKQVAILADALPKENRVIGSSSGKRIPHMTLGVFNDVDETKAEEKLKRLVRQMRRGEAHFVTAGFNAEGGIFLAPVINDFLYGIHVELHETFRFSMVGFEHYSFGKWVPHLTLARYSQDEETIMTALREVFRNFAPIKGSFDRVVLSQLGTKPREVCCFKLRD